MERDDRVTELIYGAIGQVNATLKPAEALAKSPDTILVGDSSSLGSLAFVTFLAALEESIAKATGREISVADVMFTVERDRWTVASLAECLVELIDGAAGDRRPAQVATLA